jgi:signal transduction histidine kinase
LRRDRRRRARAARLETLVAQRTAALLSEQRLKDNLLSTVSHEFRTALTAIGGFADLLELGVHGSLNEVQRGDVERIQRAYQHLARVVEDLLSYGRIASGRVAIELSDVLVLDALNGLPDLVAPQAKARDVDLSIEAIDPRLIVRADPERLRQVLLNLFSNAVKFTASRGRVQVRCRADEHHAYIEVADTGEGIPDDARDRIFEPFVRVKSQSGAAGTGLGLAIARDLARAMNGDVTLAETGSHGSRFVVRLDRSTALAERVLRG